MSGEVATTCLCGDVEKQFRRDGTVAAQWKKTWVTGHRVNTENPGSPGRGNRMDQDIEARRRIQGTVQKKKKGNIFHPAWVRKDCKVFFFIGLSITLNLNVLHYLLGFSREL